MNVLTSFQKLACHRIAELQALLIIFFAIWIVLLLNQFTKIEKISVMSLLTQFGVFSGKVLNLTRQPGSKTKTIFNCVSETQTA